MHIARPMKAVEVPNELDLIKLRYPVMVSPKLDGIRALYIPEVGFVTQSLKLVPNEHIRNAITALGNVVHYMDGELITLRDDGSMDDYNDIQSRVMTQAGIPQFEYHVFDYFEVPQNPYPARFDDLKMALTFYPLPEVGFVKLVPHTVAHNHKEVIELYDKYRAAGYEGVMIRSMDGPYKEGRATWKQQWLLKWKGERSDAEGTIIGFEELLRNGNPTTTSLLGLSKRSNHAGGMLPGNTLGRFILDTDEWGEVKVGGGIGLTAALRKKIWYNQEQYLGKRITFLFQKHGMKDKPRFPQFKGFRYD